jgi:hypothetical protein
MPVSQQKLFNYEYKIAIKSLKMFFKTRGRFSVISYLRASLFDERLAIIGIISALT